MIHGEYYVYAPRLNESFTIILEFIIIHYVPHKIVKKKNSL